MRKYTERGINGTGDVYVMESLDDFKKYEEILKDEDPYWLKSNPDFYKYRDYFEEYNGKIWYDRRELSESDPFIEYRVIEIEHNTPMDMWYWVVQNVDNENDKQYLMYSDIVRGVKKR